MNLTRKLDVAAALALALAALAGCNSQPDLDEPSHDVPYYSTHETERRAMVAKCESDPAKYDMQSNCINARDAQWKKELDADNNNVPRIPKDFHEKN